MLSVIKICKEEHKDDEFSRKLINSENEVLWGLHIWQESYEHSGYFIESSRETDDSYQHWLDILNANELIEYIEAI
jgi:hypothetical protein